jgi:hypothetical protein
MRRFFTGAFFLLLALVAAFTFAVVACDDDDDDAADDDDDGDDDNDDSSPESGVVGWLATTRTGTTATWGALYRIEGESAESVVLPETEAFLAGNAATADVIWASNYDDLVQRRDSQWRPVVPQHPCGDGGFTKGGIVPLVFGASSGVALCTGTHAFYSFDGSTWRQEAEEVNEFFCAAATRCLLSSGFSVLFWDGFGATELEQVPGIPNRLFLRSDGTPVAHFSLSDAGDYHLELWTWRESAWGPDASFEAGTRFWSPALLERFDDQRVAMCAKASDGDACWLLSPDGPAERTNWPFFQRLAFAASGSGNGLGVAADGDKWVLYRIVDEEATAIFELPEDETPTGFLVAADAE